ncbi:MAG: 16S rRNA processing protein RimM [Acidobacteria bacterium]|nr:16S rRNA processing protein RimM [Acidobacteriota bacterium]
MPSEARSESNDPEAEYVAIACIQTTHGRHGEVAADLLTDFPERFVPGLKVLIVGPGLRRSCSVEAAWFHKGRVILKFEGVDGLTEAEALRGGLVQVPRPERVPLPADRVYVSDLIGCAVLEQEEVLGTVVGWEETGAVPLLRVQSSAGELLIPYTAAICYSVDAATKQIRVKTPEGLRDLNSPAASGSRTKRQSRR